MNNINNQNRFELQKLKKKLVDTKKGHKLLKNKNDELIKQFTKMLKDFKEKKQNIESKISMILKSFSFLKQKLSPIQIEEILSLNTPLNITFSKDNFLNISYPIIKLENNDFNYAYMLNNTHILLDDLINSLKDFMKDLIFLIVEENKINIMIKEIQKIKRRVNAIENIIIKEIEENIKYINNKLIETEIANTVRTMKSKEIIMKKLKRSE